MLARIDLRGRPEVVCDPRALRAVLPRARVDVESVLGVVRSLCEDVSRRGAAAVREATSRYDGVELTTLRVAPEALTAALAELDPGVRAALVEATRRARLVHEAQRHDDRVVDMGRGARVTERWLPVRRAGLYVPGGRVAYPSSVVMNVVPAQVAGVEAIAVASPPQRGTGDPHPVILAACALLGVEEVYRVGGAQAVALLAYGAAADAHGPAVEPVDMVTGPGNVYVAAAKRAVLGVVGVDSEAGPTEVAVLADDTADPAHVAADLVAQAEHDPLAACLLVTSSPALADAVDVALDKAVPVAPHRDRVEAALAGQSAVVLVDDLDAGLAVVDEWAAEHLEVQTADAPAWARRVRNAGAVFVGPFSPVSLGDYLAGSNHVLPTGGTARHTGGLSVGSFQRMVPLVEYGEQALAGLAGHVRALGGAEDLGSHVEAVEVRLR